MQVVHLHSRLPHGHLTNRAHDMRVFARQLSACAGELRNAQAVLEQLIKAQQTR